MCSCADRRTPVTLFTPLLYTQVATSLRVIGGVPAHALMQPSVGLPLRLAVACALGAPLSTVAVQSVKSRVNSTSESSATVTLTALDPVNAATGSCGDIDLYSGATVDLKACAQKPKPSTAQPSLLVTLAITLCGPHTVPPVEAVITYLSTFLDNAAQAAVCDAAKSPFSPFLAALSKTTTMRSDVVHLAVARPPAIQYGAASIGLLESGPYVITVFAGSLLGVLAWLSSRALSRSRQCVNSQVAVSSPITSHRKPKPVTSPSGTPNGNSKKSDKARFSQPDASAVTAAPAVPTCTKAASARAFKSKHAPRAAPAPEPHCEVARIGGDTQRRTKDNDRHESAQGQVLAQHGRQDAPSREQLTGIDDRADRRDPIALLADSVSNDTNSALVDVPAESHEVAPEEVLAISHLNSESKVWLDDCKGSDSDSQLAAPLADQVVCKDVSADSAFVRNSPGEGVPLEPLGAGLGARNLHSAHDTDIDGGFVLLKATPTPSIDPIIATASTPVRLGTHAASGIDESLLATPWDAMMASAMGVSSAGVGNNSLGLQRSSDGHASGSMTLAQRLLLSGFGNASNTSISEMLIATPSMGYADDSQSCEPVEFGSCSHLTVVSPTIDHSPVQAFLRANPAIFDWLRAKGVITRLGTPKKTGAPPLDLDDASIPFVGADRAAIIMDLAHFGFITEG